MLTQPKHVSKLKILDETTFTRKEIVAELAHVSYFTPFFRPESSFWFCAASEINNLEIKYVKFLNKAIDFCTKYKDHGLNFIQLWIYLLVMDVFWCCFHI